MARVILRDSTGVPLQGDNGNVLAIDWPTWPASYSLAAPNFGYASPQGVWSYWGTLSIGRSTFSYEGNDSPVFSLFRHKWASLYLCCDAGQLFWRLHMWIDYYGQAHLYARRNVTYASCSPAGAYSIDSTTNGCTYPVSLVGPLTVS